MSGAIVLASAVAEIINKAIPSRREAIIQEFDTLEELLGKALAENEDLLVAQIRKRLKDLRSKYEDVA